MKTWHLETRKIKELLANPKNPRYIKKDMAQHLEGSIAKFGIIDKPIITKDNHIIGGHQRVTTLKKMKVKEVECWVCDEELTEEDIEEIMIGMNLHQGSFNYDILANEWNIEKLFDYGFTTEQIFDASVKDILDEESLEENEEKQKKYKMCPHCGKEIDRKKGQIDGNMIEWIYVEDKKPPENEWIYLGSSKCEMTTWGIYQDSKFINPDNNYMEIISVTHWMSLPEPPEKSPD